MRHLLVILIFFGLTECCLGQDSTTAIYIDDLVHKIEARLSADIVETKDTTVYDEGDTLGKGQFLTVHTQFYTNPQSMQLDKIVEKSMYKKVATELTVYFFGDQPVRFTNRQWDANTLKFDFDIYYMNGKSVYFVKRNDLKGSPDSDMYLKWCYELRKDYIRIVQEFNQTFASRKSR